MGVSLFKEPQKKKKRGRFEGAEMSLEPDSAEDGNTLPALVGQIQHIPHCKEDQPKPQQGEQTPLLFPRWDLG